MIWYVSPYITKINYKFSKLESDCNIFTKKMWLLTQIRGKINLSYGTWDTRKSRFVLLARSQLNIYCWEITMPKFGRLTVYSVKVHEGGEIMVHHAKKLDCKQCLKRCWSNHEFWIIEVSSKKQNHLFSSVEYYGLQSTGFENNSEFWKI